ncbi:MAG: pyruvate:ferredoxin (flavodoxin) oxidoreductase [Candidatus Lightella neohaematopini]|nr:pyruvate:ferredoxin (flavodoxin) oxidoreductase [Candidatus Lightella neohaematopini]
MVIIDGNQSVANIAYVINEIITIYPITPSSTMSDLVSQWSDSNLPNVWGDVPKVIKMQSEVGVIASIHGALQTGSLATSFTSSQGLLLMIPSLYKIAGQLMPFVLHVATRSIATSSLSIFSDHSDVMAARTTGCAMLCSSSVQEAQDFALISQATSLNSRIPFIHFFDGFRTSHEINKINSLNKRIICSIISQTSINNHRKRSLDPNNPLIRGVSTNDDVYFQSREASNIYYNNVLKNILFVMNKFYLLTGRKYNPFEYYGHLQATSIIVVMGSASCVCKEVVMYLIKKNYKVGVIITKLYRPFFYQEFIKVLPKTVSAIAVLDRTKEPGSSGEPLYLDVNSSLTKAFYNKQIKCLPIIINGRFGLGSKEFSLNCVFSIFKELNKNNPKLHFTVGIHDDVTNLSLIVSNNKYSLHNNYIIEAIFYGISGDGSVSAAKNSVTIIGNNTNLFVQSYSHYDSRKSGSLTSSHIRVSNNNINAPYLIKSANFISCGHWQILNKYNILNNLSKNGILLINTVYCSNKILDMFSDNIKLILYNKRIKLYIINAKYIANKYKLGSKTNIIMQVIFFKLIKILPMNIVINHLKNLIIDIYESKNKQLVLNYLNLLPNISKLIKLIPIKLNTIGTNLNNEINNNINNYTICKKNLIYNMIHGLGNYIPVSMFPVDGSWYTGTSKLEKRNLADYIPVWNASLCKQCNYCVAICPHTALRVKIVDNKDLDNKPDKMSFLSLRLKNFKDKKYILQVSPEDCTGCRLCVEACPVVIDGIKAINMKSNLRYFNQEKINFNFFKNLPDNININNFKKLNIRTSQFIQPLFEYPSACAGCGETSYIKLLTQLYGKKLIIANATGCSSIYSGNLPTTPYTKDSSGKGPAWANSLFEDNAEFGLGFKLSVNFHKKRVLRIMNRLKKITPNLNNYINIILNKNELSYEYIEEIKKLINNDSLLKNTIFYNDLNYLINRSIWIIGGDGWAYDIGVSGLQYVLNSRENINILVLDTQCYSNTGGQYSNATPLGAVTKFSKYGKLNKNNDLGLNIISTYDHIYVAQISIGANFQQTIKAIQEAELYNGPSLVIAYSPCIEHGYDLSYSYQQVKKLTSIGFWPLYRFNPNLIAKDINPLTIDYSITSNNILSTLIKEQRFRRLYEINQKKFYDFLQEIKKEIRYKFDYLLNISKKFNK